MKKYSFILKILKKYWVGYLAGIICLLFVDFLELVLPRIFGLVTDRLKEGNITAADLLKYALIIMGIAVAAAIFRFIWRYLIFGNAKKVDRDLRADFYSHLQTLSPQYYNNHKTGDLMAHATNDLKNVEMAVGQGFAMSVDSLCIPIVALIVMIRTAGLPLTLACFSPMVFLAVAVGVNSKLMYDRINKMQEAFSDLTEKVRENIAGIRVIKAFVQEKAELTEFEKVNRNNLNMNLKYAKNLQILFPFIMSISSLTTAIALLYGGYLVANGQLSLGNFISFNTYLLLLIWPIAAIGWVTTLFQRGYVSLLRVSEILDTKPDITDENSAPHGENIRGNIEVRNLTFTYPSSAVPALTDINIDIKEGRTLAIVGRTGSGKSTLSNLLLRLYDTDGENIFIDGTEIKKLPLSVLRGNIGYVPQDTFLFSSKISDNIDFFGGHSMEEIQEASKISCVYDNIAEFPDGFDTVIGERGITLSGGQKQRIAISRAIIRNPSILILDDCLSAVDTGTEEKILKGLRQIMKERTSIIISHRISTLKDADEIIVLDQGKIAERGTHEELLSIEGIYYELYQKQLLADEVEGVE